MRFYLLLAMIPLGTFAAVSLLSALAVSAAWPRFRRSMSPLTASVRARRLAAIRLLPCLAAAIMSTVVAVVFIRYEPRQTEEMPGLLLMALAAGSMALAAGAIARSVQSWIAGARCSRLLRQCGRPWISAEGRRIWLVDTAYPVAAVTGLFRTRLLLSTRIIRECTSSEVEAVIRHEAAHVRRRDNVVRAAMRCLPDPLLFMKAGAELQEAWAAAAEEAADDEAAGPQVDERTELAAALVRVARMADGPPPGWMPALAFYEGTNLEGRVRRLLATGTGVQRTRVSAVAAMCGVLLAGGLLLLTDSVSRELHAAMELAVRYLP